MVRSLHALGRLKRVYCTETRPYNQGSRLTAYEAVAEGIPATLITDSMAALTMREMDITGVETRRIGLSSTSQAGTSNWNKWRRH